MCMDIAHLTAFRARHLRQDGRSPQAGGARCSQASQWGRAQMLQEGLLSCSQRSEPLLAQLGSLLVEGLIGVINADEKENDKKRNCDKFLVGWLGEGKHTERKCLNCPPKSGYKESQFTTNKTLTVKL